MGATSETVDLAEWIIDDTCLVILVTVLIDYLSFVPLGTMLGKTFDFKFR